MASGGFFLLGDSLSGLLDNAGADAKDAAMEAAEEIAQRMLLDAQENAPWSDRTGAARQGLQVETADEGDIITVTLAHSVDYGQWLETIQSGRFAVIMPTVERYAAEIHRAIAGGVFSGGD